MGGARHILIAGGGIIGLCCAYYAAERGHQVTLLEKGNPDHDSCSLGNAGMVVPSHFVPLAAPGAVALGLKWMWNPASPFYIKPRLDLDLIKWAWRFYLSANRGHVERSAPLLRDLSLASRSEFVALSKRHSQSFGLVEKGLIMLCKTQHSLDEEAAAAAKANQLGVPARVLSPAEIGQLDPGVRYDVVGGVHFPKDCHLNPRQLVEELTRNLIARGAKIRFGTSITGWQTSADRVEAVTTNAGTLKADEYVVAGGSWSPDLAKGLGVALPMQAGKGYSLTLTQPRQLPELCSIFTEARVAVTPMGGSLRFGGTMEIAGLDETINPLRVRGIINAVPKYLPEFKPEDFETTPVWRGLRPCSPDGLPYVGRLSRYTNCSVASGHAMMGLSLGPITGRLMSEILSGEKPSIDLSLLKPDRFG